MAPRKVNSRTAVLGGDGRDCPDIPDGARIYRSSRSGGDGELRRLLAALRAGAIERVLILARWNGHSATAAVQKLCRRLGIRVEMVV